MEFEHTNPGRPAKRADLGVKSVALSFRVDPAFKNLLLDVSEGSGISMTELFTTLVLREAGFESLEAYRDTIRDTIEDLV
jgi:hypothetical protein